MPATSTVLDEENLVPAARFGAALHRERAQSGATMAAIARESDGRFLPDQLVVVERGAATLSDADVVLLARLYGLGERAWASASSLELVLDRVPMSDIGTGGPTTSDRTREESLSWVAARFLALSVLLGIDVTSGPVGLDVLADAVELSLDATVDLVATTLDNDAATVGSMIGEMESRVVVPEVGFLVAETTTGSLLLVGRGPSATDAVVVPACGALSDLLEAVR